MQHSTVRNLLDTLHACLAVAVGEGTLASNPVTRYGKWIMRLPAKRKHIEIFTAPELQHLLRPMRDTNPRGYAILLLLARTGLRIGEALTLQLGDLDLVNRELWARRTWGSRRANLSWPDRINTPKSGERRVDMSQQLCTVLREDLAKHRRPGIWLFPAKSQDRPMTPQNFQSVYWAPLFRSKLFAYRNVHVLRHTCASLMLANGESLHYIKQQLGHSSIRIAVDVYGHLLPGGNKLAVDRLEEPIRKSSASSKKPHTLSA